MDNPYQNNNFRTYIYQRSFVGVIFLTLIIYIVHSYAHEFNIEISNNAVAIIYLFPVLIHSVRYSLFYSLITSSLCIIFFTFLTLVFHNLSFLNFANFVILQLSVIATIKIAKNYYLEVELCLNENKIHLDAITTVSYIKVDTDNINALIHSIENEYRRILDSEITLLIPYTNEGTNFEQLIKDKLTEPNFVLEDHVNSIKCWKKKKTVWSGKLLSLKKKWQWFIIKDKNKTIGAIGIKISLFELFINPKEKKLIFALNKQTGEVINRSLIYQKDSQAQEANYKLSMAILSSISHDLKTPLTAIIGSLSAIRYLGEKIDAETRNSLLLEAEEEAVQLNRFISNLLNMIKLQSGEVQLNLEWCNPIDIVRNVLKRLQFKKNEQIKYIPESTVSLFKVDSVLIEQVLQNMIENALKAAPSSSDIIIRSYINENKEGCFTVEDYGPGIPVSMRTQVFTKFFSVQHFESQTPGSG
ncbi:MAG: ATP-binding protein [Alphaproteobacteria bacterium]